MIFIEIYFQTCYVMKHVVITTTVYITPSFYFGGCDFHVRWSYFDIGVYVNADMDKNTQQSKVILGTMLGIMYYFSSCIS